MAYMDFGNAAFAGMPAASSPAPAPRGATGLAALDWLVVALAERDGLSSLREPGRIASALGRLFGSGRTGSRLADPRLEALRRFAVFAWTHGYNLPASEFAAFGAAGFTPDQADVLLTSVVGRRAARNGRRRAA